MALARTLVASGVAALVLTGCGGRPAPADPPALGFQGVPWNASLAEVRKSFPTVKEVPCAPKIADALGSHGISCTLLSVSNYRVSDVDFEVTFYLDKDKRTVREVALTSAVDVTGGASNPAEKALATCNRFQSLLTQRYGIAEVKQSASSTAEVGREAYRDARGNAPTGVMIWCYYDGTRPTLELSIGYKPRKASEADKL